MSTPADRSRPDPSRLRVGDRERDRAAAALGGHYADGRLTAAEHSDRLDAVWSARTRADLDLLFHDLPAVEPAPPRAAPARRSSGPRPWMIVLAVVGGVVLLSEVPVVLLLLALVAFVAVRRHRRRQRRVAGQIVWR